MKAIVISDIHGSSFYAKKINDICLRENPDIIIVLGDLYYHGPRNELSMEYNPMLVADILNGYRDKLYVIRGNCDAEVDEMISNFTFYDNLKIDINGKRYFLTHGHKYNIESLPKDEFDVMLYGHFHTGFIKEKDGKYFVNPGSISLPKGGTCNSYAVIDCHEIALKNISGDIISEINI